MNADTLLTLGTPILTPIVIALVKSITDHVPAKWLPCVSMLIGALADGLVALTTGHQFAPGQGALLGLAGVGIREAIDQLKPKVTVEQVKLMVAGLFLISFMACKTAPETVAYKTLGSIAISVQGATHAYYDSRDHNPSKVSPELDSALKKAYLRYQEAFNVAEAAERVALAGGSKTSPETLAAVTNASAALLELVRQITH